MFKLCIEYIQGDELLWRTIVPGHWASSESAPESTHLLYWALFPVYQCSPGSPELVGFRSHHSFGAMVLTTTKSVPYSHFVSAANMHFVPDLAQSAFNLLAMIAMLAASKKYNFTQRGKIIFSQCLVKGRWVKKSPLPGWPQLLIVSEEW